MSKSAKLDVVAQISKGRTIFLFHGIFGRAIPRDSFQPPSSFTVPSSALTNPNRINTTSFSELQRICRSTIAPDE